MKSLTLFLILILPSVGFTEVEDCNVDIKSKTLGFEYKITNFEKIRKNTGFSSIIFSADEVISEAGEFTEFNNKNYNADPKKIAEQGFIFSCRIDTNLEKYIFQIVSHTSPKDLNFNPILVDFSDISNFVNNQFEGFELQINTELSKNLNVLNTAKPNLNLENVRDMDHLLSEFGLLPIPKYENLCDENMLEVSSIKPQDLISHYEFSSMSACFISKYKEKGQLKLVQYPLMFQDTESRLGTHAIHTAIRRRSSALISFLASIGSDINAQMARSGGLSDYGPFEILADTKNKFHNENYTYLQNEYANYGLVAERLMSLGAGDYYNTTYKPRGYKIAFNTSNIELLEFFLTLDFYKNYILEKQYNGYTQLHYAILAEDAALLELFLQHGLDIQAKNRIGETPLHFASEHTKDFEIFNILFKTGEPNIEALNASGQSPIFYSLTKTNYDNFHFLMDKDANLNLIDNLGNNLINILIDNFRSYSNFEETSKILKILIEKGVNINNINNNGFSPLTTVIYSIYSIGFNSHFDFDQSTLIKLLLDNGAIPDESSRQLAIQIFEEKWENVYNHAKKLKQEAADKVIKLIDPDFQVTEPLNLKESSNNEQEKILDSLNKNTKSWWRIW